MATPVPADEPLELIERLIAGVLHLIYFAHGRPERTRLERSWWSLRSLKHGAEAALAGLKAAPGDLGCSGRNMLIAHCDAERSGVYRSALQLGLVPRVGTRTWMEPSSAAPPPPTATGDAPSHTSVAGQGLGNLMGL